MKKVFVSARAKYRLNDAKDIIHKFKKANYRVTFDWTDAEVKRPYRQSKNRKFNTEFHKKSLLGAATTDIFILLDDEGLRGAYVELGAFLYSCLQKKDGRRAFIVGPDSHAREHVFESPEFVKFCDTIEEVYKDLGIE